MSKIYDALIGHREPSIVAKELINEPSTYLPQVQTGSRSLSIPRFHEESELLALAQNIAAFLPNANPMVIQFIGSHKGEGTSTLIREFALTEAKHSSKPVLLVDADINQTSQAQAFAIEAKPPLDYALKEGKPLDGLISQIEKSNLFLATLSPQFFRPLTNRSFFPSKDIWKIARNQFSLILIDSSPVNVSVDGLSLCGFVNGVVLVLEAEKTRSAVVQNVKREILRGDGNLLGIVFNKRKFHIPKSIHKLL